MKDRESYNNNSKDSAMPEEPELKAIPQGGVPPESAPLPTHYQSGAQKHICHEQDVRESSEYGGLGY